MVTVEIKGYEQAKQVLDQIPQELHTNIIRSALKSTAKPLQKSAREHAPHRTGQLASKIKSSYINKRNLAPTEVAISVGPTFFKYKSGKVNAFYGRFVHQGTKRGVKANPFLERAYSDTETQMISIFGSELGAAVERFAKRKFIPIT